MAATTQMAKGGAQAPPDARPNSIASLLLRIGALAIIDAITIWLVYQMLDDGIWQLAAVLALVTIWVNVVFLSGRFYPLRYVAPGVSLMAIMVAYPILFTVFVSFTNYGTGHLVTQQVAIEQIESRVFLAPDATVYTWTAFQEPTTREYMLWMTDPNTGAHFTVTPGGEPVVREDAEPPASIDGFNQVPRNQLFGILGELSALCV
jgi:hypothetical protein